MHCDCAGLRGSSKQTWETTMALIGGLLSSFAASGGRVAGTHMLTRDDIGDAAAGRARIHDADGASDESLPADITGMLNDMLREGRNRRTESDFEQDDREGADYADGDAGSGIEGGVTGTGSVSAGTASVDVDGRRDASAEAVLDSMYARHEALSAELAELQAALAAAGTGRDQDQLAADVRLVQGALSSLEAMILEAEGLGDEDAEV